MNEVEQQVVNRLATAEDLGIVGNGSTVILLPTTRTRSCTAIRLRVKSEEGLDYIDIEEKALECPFS